MKLIDKIRWWHAPLLITLGSLLGNLWRAS
jgi:hypothetical protein